MEAVEEGCMRYCTEGTLSRNVLNNNDLLKFEWLWYCTGATLVLSILKSDLLEFEWLGYCMKRVLSVRMLKDKTLKEEHSHFYFCRIQL